jgi:alkylation response protein AidB-like acyl-CoA dehydrogenase
VNFTFSDEQEELRKTIRRFCDEKSPSAEARRLMETEAGYDEAVWKQMAGELGLQGLAIPEAYGGQGFGLIELGIVMEEFGRALVCAPLFSSVCLAASAILNAGTEEQKQALLPGIVAGERIATLALIGQNRPWGTDGIAVEASAGGRLTGTASYVTDGYIADTLIVAARTDDDVGLFVLDGDAEGVTREPLNVMDPTRKQAKVTLDGAQAERLGGDGGPAIAKTLQQAAVMLAAESAGGAQAALDMAVAYAKERRQFGRPIGQFQAVKHLCANMLLLVESSKTAAYYAMWAAAEDNEEVPVVSSLAKAYCTESFFQVASDNIQVHGGIGFTWEHDAHLYYKRAKSSELLLGDPVYHRDLLADRIGI